MKKVAVAIFVLYLLGPIFGQAAEEADKPTTVSSATASPQVSTEVPAAPVIPAQLEPTVAPAPSIAKEAPAAENLEFVSGEITAVDEAAKSISVKLYGETENSASEKVLSIKLDETTDITDGEKDRDIKSLTVGTEVDVEYVPASNKATYVFVY